jgi:ABC-type multidrug transport system permease subunit
MRVIPPLLLAAVTYYMIGYHPGLKHFLYYSMAMVLVGVVSTSMCLAISSSCPSLSMANLIAILILLFYLLFGGLLANKASIPSAIRWFKWLSFLNYAYEILMVNELSGTSIYFDPQDYNVKPMNVNGEVFLKQFDMDAARLQSDIFTLLGMICFYLLLSYTFLRFLVREKR